MLAAATILVSSACGGSGSRVSEPARTTTTPYRGATLPDSSEAPDFALRDQDGTTVSMSSQRGRFTLVTFLYTNCPDVCPLIAEHLNTALRQLGATRADTRVLAVSVDPIGDTPSAVGRFVAEHHLLPQFRYLSGTVDQLRPIWAAYHVAADPQSGTTAIGHSAYVLLVDPHGTERLLYDSRVRAADIVHDINALKEK